MLVLAAMVWTTASSSPSTADEATAAVADHYQEKPLVVLIMRGQSFRTGGQNSEATDLSPSQQLRVHSSAVKNLIFPLRQNGWDVELFVDTVLTSSSAELFTSYSDILREPWNGTVAPVHVRVRKRFEYSRLKEVKESLRWANETSPGLLSRAAHIAVARMDAMWKSNLNLPLRPASDAVTVLGMMPDLARFKRIVDTFFWIPRPMVKAFIAAIPPDYQLHRLNDVLPCVVLFHSLHHSDSSRGWNPSYKLCGRVGRPFNSAPNSRWTQHHSTAARLLLVQNLTSSPTPSSSSSSSNVWWGHRLRMVPGNQGGLDGTPTLELVIAWVGVEAPCEGLDKQSQVLIDQHEVYAIILEGRQHSQDSHHGRVCNATATSSSTAVHVAHVVLPMKIDRGRVEFSWAAPGSTIRTAAAAATAAQMEYSRSATDAMESSSDERFRQVMGNATSVLVVRLPLAKGAVKTPPDFIPAFHSWPHHPNKAMSKAA